MARLTLEDIKDTGTAAIRRVIGDDSLQVEFRLDFDRDDRPEYSFRLLLPTPEAWRGASNRILEMTDDGATHGAGRRQFPIHLASV